MLATRVIPTLLADGRRLVKGERFRPWRVCGHVAQAARTHQLRGVDELVVLDVAATRERRGPNLDLVEEIARDCFMPLAVGGGITHVNQVQDLLRAGADKVVVGAALETDPMLATRIADRFGSQVLVAAVNYHSHETEDAIDHAIGLAKHGAGEILLTSKDREGTLSGYDLDTLRRLANAIETPVIAHGGAGTLEHMLAAVEAGASAVAAGAMFQWTDVTPQDVARYLQENGVEARA